MLFRSGDLSEPVTQATLRIVKVFWGLDDRLAARKHFPAINWLISYSLYSERMAEFLRDNIAHDFPDMREQAMALLQQEAELQEIVRLVGMDALSFTQRMVIETAKSLREDFLYQSAFHEVDTYCSLKKQYSILKLILMFHNMGLKAVAQGVPMDRVLSLPVRGRITRARLVPEDQLVEFESIEDQIRAEMPK